MIYVEKKMQESKEKLTMCFRFCAYFRSEPKLEVYVAYLELLKKKEILLCKEVCSRR